MEKINLEMANDCIALIKKGFEGNISGEQFYLALMELSMKNDIRERMEPLPLENLRNYRELGLQPLTFKEAAEMYIRHHQKVIESPGVWGPMYSFYKKGTRVKRGEDRPVEDRYEAGSEGALSKPSPAHPHLKEEINGRLDDRHALEGEDRDMFGDDERGSFGTVQQLDGYEEDL